MISTLLIAIINFVLAATFAALGIAQIGINQIPTLFVLALGWTELGIVWMRTYFSERDES